MTQTLTLAALDFDTIFNQAEAIYSNFLPLLGVLIGIGIGVYVWRRLRGAAMGV